jgi:hypothetical protein
MLEETESLVLIALRDGADRATFIRRPPAAARNAPIAVLEQRGWILSRKQGRALLLTLTAEGRRIASTLTAPVGAAKGDRLAQILARLDELARAVARIEARFAAEPTPGRVLGVAMPPHALRDAVLETLRTLDARHRYGGLVPIPELRRALAPAAAAQVNAALFSLERDYLVDLSVAQAPTQIADATAGIERPGRGLLYYVTPRAPS